MNKLIYYLILIVLPACKQEEPQIIRDANGVITSMPELWISPLSVNGKEEITIWGNASYYNTVVVSSWNGTKDGLMGLSAKTGEKLWGWYDDFDNYSLSVAWHHVENNKLIWEESRELYCIDMSSGATIFKKRYESEPYLRAVTAKLDNIYVIGESYLPNDETSPSSVRLYKTSVNENGELLEIAKPINNGIIYSGQNNYSFAGSATVVTINGHELVLFNSIEPDEVINKSRSYLHLFDVTANQWIYQHVLITNDTDSFLQKRPGVWGDFVYLVMNDWLICTDLMSGNIIWEKKFTEHTNFVTSGYYIAEKEGLLLVNAEAFGTTLYAFDLETGQEIWETPSSGTSTEMQYLNGIVYFVGGGDGLLHAVEVETGKHIWKLVSPYNSKGDYFTSYCAVVSGEDGEKGKVVVTSGLHAFAYEAAK